MSTIRTLPRHGSSQRAHDQLVGGIPTPLKNISQLGLYFQLFFPTSGKIKNVPNHQPDDVPQIYPSTSTTLKTAAAMLRH
jgi:hypothetical protein